MENQEAFMLSLMRRQMATDGALSNVRVHRWAHTRDLLLHRKRGPEAVTLGHAPPSARNLVSDTIPNKRNQLLKERADSKTGREIHQMGLELLVVPERKKVLKKIKMMGVFKETYKPSERAPSDQSQKLLKKIQHWIVTQPTDEMAHSIHEERDKSPLSSVFW